MVDSRDSTSTKTGLERGLTSYGDADFALYLRRSFARSMGYSREMLERPVVGIADTSSDFNNCHRHFPELVESAAYWSPAVFLSRSPPSPWERSS
jgi:dihydroxy-acid dehydratase